MDKSRAIFAQGNNEVITAAAAGVRNPARDLVELPLRQLGSAVFVFLFRRSCHVPFISVDFLKLLLCLFIQKNAERDS